MGSDTKEVVYGPVHKVCESNVAVPTIVRVNMGPEGEEKPTLCVQWFGDPERPLLPNVKIPDGSQFLFSLMVDPDDLNFFGDPAKLRVVFLGKIKDWLKPEAVQAMIDGPGKGNPDAPMIWLLNPQRIVSHSGERKGPASPLVPIALLGDPNCGVIAPRLFSDIGVRDAVMAEFSASESNT